MVCSLEASVEHQSKKLKDLEDYLDNLLLRVMETTPRILQNPYVTCKAQANLW
jgi:Rab11 family-interacting protein 1/2/5